MSLKCNHKYLYKRETGDLMQPERRREVKTEAEVEAMWLPRNDSSHRKQKEARKRFSSRVSRGADLSTPAISQWVADSRLLASRTVTE